MALTTRLNISSGLSNQGLVRKVGLTMLKEHAFLLTRHTHNAVLLSN
jgi:hypothetical protein